MGGIIGSVGQDSDNEIEIELTLEAAANGASPLPWRADHAIHPEVAELTERVVAAYRGLNERLGWIEDPARFDGLIRASTQYFLGWGRETYPDDWISEGLWGLAIQLPNDLAEETTEPWPLRALEHPPGQRTWPEPTVEITDGVARIRYGAYALDPIALP